MSRGRRYETEGKLNYQKVFAVIIAIIVIAMVVMIIKNVFIQREKLNKEYEYFTAFSADKWGVINQDGETVINPSYQEMIVIPDKTKDVFICTYDINEEDGTYKTKALNGKNEEIFTQYDQIQVLENIDENDNIWYEKNVLKVMQNGKYGLIDLNGKKLLDCEYDEISAMKGIENSLLIRKDGYVGLANNAGTILIDVKYSDIKNLGTTYKEGYITTDENGKCGIVSTTKIQILENKYNEIKQVYLGDNYYVVEDGEEKIINQAGETLIDKGFDDIKSSTKRGIIFTQKDLYGEMTTSGDILIEAKYKDLKEAKEGIYIAKKDEKYGIIDRNELTFGMMEEVYKYQTERNYRYGQEAFNKGIRTLQLVPVELESFLNGVWGQHASEYVIAKSILDELGIDVKEEDVKKLWEERKLELFKGNNPDPISIDAR